MSPGAAEGGAGAEGDGAGAEEVPNETSWVLHLCERASRASGGMLPARRLPMRSGPRGCGAFHTTRAESKKDPLASKGIPDGVTLRDH